ncbi:SsgA family sporulation/cell division regulator [Streptomyces sp. NBC_00536]|uniref:SsgA family sporulation/cell division regulator n=1 Tax=Streptomyces sp. NBC_00536 TaxID=2975769 RepID=UPI002E81D84E|nr:SsgA family sporulation/cell division regulator [Streptomyces sp. NBC_00536]WUC77084.1 SsgA family sporulation/cell division regulator [Streptomyces sp. NBC_00536]
MRQLTGGDIDVHSVFTYRADDPFAVSIGFSCAGEHIEWWVGREVLHEGLMWPSGIPGADIRVLPLGRHGMSPSILLALTSPFGRALVEFATHEIVAFLNATDQLVPQGTESAEIDMDGAIADMLGSA